MKKILVIMLLLLAGCSHREIQLEMEENAVLDVAVANENYGQAFLELWNETYPDQKDTLNIHVLEENEIENYILSEMEIPYDIFYIEDSWVGLIMDDLYEMPGNFSADFDVEINPEFTDILARVKPVYYPIEANGFLYAIDEKLMEEKNLTLEDFASFENMAQIDDSFYYIEQPVVTIPLLSSDQRYFPGKNRNTLELDGAPFRTSLTNYLTIMEMLELEDDPDSFDNWFLNQEYLSGLIGPWMQADRNEEVNDASYIYRPLPTINEQPLYTIASSYGYVIQADTSYPQTALICLKLMHSFEGMQVLCDTTAQVPLILESQMEEFDFAQNNQEEKVLAMNYALQDNLVGLEAHPEIGAMEFLEEAETIDLINSCESEDIQGCLTNIHEAYQEWMESLDENEMT